MLLLGVWVPDPSSFCGCEKALDLQMVAHDACSLCTEPHGTKRNQWAPFSQRLSAGTPEALWWLGAIKIAAPPTRTGSSRAWASSYGLGGQRASRRHSSGVPIAALSLALVGAGLFTSTVEILCFHLPSRPPQLIGNFWLPYWSIHFQVQNVPWSVLDQLINGQQPMATVRQPVSSTLGHASAKIVIGWGLHRYSIFLQW